MPGSVLGAAPGSAGNLVRKILEEASSEAVYVYILRVHRYRVAKMFPDNTKCVGQNARPRETQQNSGQKRGWGRFC